MRERDIQQSYSYKGPLESWNLSPNEEHLEGEARLKTEGEKKVGLEAKNSWHWPFLVKKSKHGKNRRSNLDEKNGMLINVNI
uniref:Uncharacterized protein n=1 Tax=Romanomermis culicivorax TaxID=13658 RepID=A0A915K9E5_ROMCU